MENALLEAIIRCTYDAITVVDEKGNGILINPAYTKITGLTESDVINKPASVAVSEGESMHLKVLATREPVHGVRLKMGPAKKEVVVDVAPVIVDGELRGSVGVIHDISEIKRLSKELADARDSIRHMQVKYSFDDIIVASDAMKNVVEQARRAAGTMVTVLIRGESGTGKELFAHAIHYDSERRHGPFIRVNCASITPSILESELFGYEPGAFTGSLRGGKKGYFEGADGGTIFLDEIGEISVGLQVRLLRVLQEREIVRVGGLVPVPVNVRIIAATNADLEKKVERNEFRKDLYYRLNVLPLVVPPLRQRRADIPFLASHLIRKAAGDFGRKIPRISPEALQILFAYNWPGNVRELENAIERALISMATHEEVILPTHLTPLGINVPARRTELRGVISEMERMLIIQALAENQGNRTMTAKQLGISKRSLYNKLDKYGLT